MGEDGENKAMSPHHHDHGKMDDRIMSVNRKKRLFKFPHEFDGGNNLLSLFSFIEPSDRSVPTS